MCIRTYGVANQFITDCGNIPWIAGESAGKKQFRGLKLIENARQVRLGPGFAAPVVGGQDTRNLSDIQ